MAAPDLQEPVPVSCLFGAGRLIPLLDAIAAESAGIRADDDPEHVHRMRVASRRLRAALPHFAACFAAKDYSRWMQEVKKITRALGDARDLDVQIAFIKKYIKTQGVQKGDPLSALLVHLQERRKVLQKQVCSVLDRLESATVIPTMQAACRAAATPKQKQWRRHYAGILPVAADRIGRRMAGLDRYAAYVQNPDAVFEHHALRIAAKKLRYTLEIYAPLYRRGFKKQIARLKKMQDLLGDMHDCDVWIGQMTRAIVRQRARPFPKKTLPGAAVSAIAPFRRLLANRERERARLYRQFFRYWNTLERTGFWEDLRQSALEGQKKAFCRCRLSPENEERGAFAALAATAPEHAAHGETVATLSLLLFDELGPLHGLGRRDRALLSYAALVHDIGWTDGQEHHQKTGAARVLACPDLPVPVREQGIAALVAGLHGGKAEGRKTGFWQLLSTEDRHRVLALAALLRVADGLDYLHAGNVTGLHCTVGETDVVCTVTCTGDATAGKARALKKSDLFFEVFDKTLVIP